MNFLFLNLNWGSLVSKRTYKVHFALPPLDLLLMQNSLDGRTDSGVIHDGFVDDAASLAGLIERADWLIVTTSPYHMWQCPNIEWDFIKSSVRSLPLEKVVLTGLHGSVFPENTLRETGVRALIRREPEAVFREYLAVRDWRLCHGVSYLEGEDYRENSFAVPPAMDELVVQNYDIDLSRYRYFLLGKRTGVFEASRGCPWRCTFCDQEMFGWTYRTKSPEVFAEEVARGVRQTSMKTCYFFDLEFTTSVKRTVAICEALTARGINRRKLRWCCQTRADMVDEERLTALREAGCVLIHFGVESGNPRILAATGKKTDTETIERGVRLAKKMGFETACFFMFGLPEEEPEEFDVTVEFARTINPTYASFHFAVPFPGTPLYQRYLKEKGLPWGIWPSVYFDRWSDEERSGYVRQAFKKFYLMPRRWEAKQFFYRLHHLPMKLSHFRALS